MSSFITLSRRDLLTGIPLAMAGAVALPWRAIARAAEPQYVEVKTKYGRLRGARTGDLTTFKGIPYGGSVSGANRFKAAPALEPWDGVRDALTPGPSSPQPGPRRGDAPVLEDCLTLNIWTPAADNRRRPVMFYNHGGGFTTGSGSSGHQDGSNLARTFDVVVVATTHRLGLMGYLYLGALGGEEYASSGIQGMLDIRDGLKWVHENIEAFGGDPGNVMIFGESGGGAKTSALYAMPSAAPYFHKASIESGPGIRMYPRESAAETTLMVLDKLGVAKNDWRKLLDVPVEKLMEVQGGLGQGGPLSLDNGRKGMSGSTRPGGFGPIVDGTFLPRHPFDPEPPSFSRNKPLLSGFDRDETVFFFNQQRQLDVYSLTEDQLKARLDTAFGQHAGAVYAAYSKGRPGASPTDLYIAITTARMISVGAATIAERKAKQGGAPAYMYMFKHENPALIPGTQHKMGTPHAMDIAYKFYNVRAGGTGGGNADDVKASHNFAELWSTFARTGKPAAKGQPEWPAYAAARRATYYIDAECEVVNDPYPLERQLWERIDP